MLNFRNGGIGTQGQKTMFKSDYWNLCIKIYYFLILSLILISTKKIAVNILVLVLLEYFAEYHILKTKKKVLFKFLRLYFNFMLFVKSEMF